MAHPSQYNIYRDNLDLRYIHPSQYNIYRDNPYLRYFDGIKERKWIYLHPSHSGQVGHSVSSAQGCPSNQEHASPSVHASRSIATSRPNTQEGTESWTDSHIESQWEGSVPPQDDPDAPYDEPCSLNEGYEIGHVSSCTQHNQNSGVNARAIAPSQPSLYQGASGPVTGNTARKDEKEDGRVSKDQSSLNGQWGKDSRAKLDKGANGKSKGLARFYGGQMEHREANESDWKPAVYHEALRDTLIAEASSLGTYDHPREHGVAANDVTSSLACQKEWGPDRDRDWPKIKDNVLHRFERQNYPIPDYTPEVWYHEGRIVLDPDNHAILKYEIIPATLSSELSGRDMEAMRRLDLRITRGDFRARMPSTILSRGKGRAQVEKPLHSLSAIGMRTTRFRKENGMVSWTEREGSGTIRQHTLDRMPHENVDANSTQGLSLPTLFEQQDSRSSNKGKFLKRAGTWALSDGTRKKRAVKEEERLQKLHAAHIEAKQQLTVQVGAKRRREDDRASEVGEESRQRKRPRGSIPPQVSHPISNVASESQFRALSEVQSNPENQSFSAPLLAGHKRRRDEFSDDQENFERPSKRRDSRIVPSQPSTTSTSLPRQMLKNRGPWARHLRPQPKQTSNHLVEENRLDVSSAFNGESNTHEAQGQGQQSEESRLQAALEGWLAQEPTATLPASFSDSGFPVVVENPQQSAAALPAQIQSPQPIPEEDDLYDLLEE